MAKLSSNRGLVSEMMKRFFAVILFSLLWTPAFAQCNGVFGASTLCGTVAGGPPGPIPFSSVASGSVNAGTINQVAYYAASGATISGTTTLPTGTSLNLIYMGGQIVSPAFTGSTTSRMAAFGYLAGSSLVLGSDTEATAFGWEALQTGTCATSCGNAAFGYRALQQCTSCTLSTGLGNAALLGMLTASADTAVGHHSMFGTPGNNNTGVGAFVMTGTGAGSDNGAASNTAVGYSALENITNGSFNNAFGSLALENVGGGTENTGLGDRAGGGITSGSDNVMIGEVAGFGIQTGSNNVIIGDTAGQSAAAGGGGNVFIGFSAGKNESGSNTLHIDNGNGEGSAAAKPLIGGSFQAKSLYFSVFGGGAGFNGHILADSSVLGAPAVSSCGSSPSPSVTGSDVQGQITVGGSAPTACTLTFTTAFGVAPACVISSNTAITSPTVTTTTAHFVIGAGATMAGDVISYLCFSSS